MSGTIAQLGFAVNSSEAVQATTDLERLVQAGTKAEKAADSMAAGFDKAATATSGLASAEGKLSETTEAALTRLNAMAAASLASSEYYQRLTASVKDNAGAMDAARASTTDFAAIQRNLNTLTPSLDQQTEATKRAAAATGVQAEGLQALLAKINPTIAAFERLDQQQELLKQHLKAGHIDTDQFKSYSSDIEATRKSLHGFDDGLNKTEKTAKQTEMALRQLPSQFTDIFTSLAGGQNPLLVLIQQGGQIKDSFGGVGNTFDVLKDKFKSLFSFGPGSAELGVSLAGIAANSKEVAENVGEAGESLSDLAESSNTAAEAADNAQRAYSALPPSVTGASMSVMSMAAAVTVGVAAIGLLIYGYSKGSKETDEFNNALILTGNYAGTSAGRLADLAQQVSATNGTTGEAAASLAKLAASGAIAGDSFKDIADAAAAMEDATGKSVDATIAEFVKIAKDPVAAAKELNDQYHFLTASVYSQIVALKEQGDTIGAAKLLTDIYADTVKGRAGEITQNLGTIEKAWKGITDEAKKSIDAVRNIGRDEGPAKRIAELTQSVAFARSALKADPADTDAKKKLTDSEKELYQLQLMVFTGEQRTKSQEDQVRIQKEGIEAEQHLKQISDANLTNAEKRDKLTKKYLLYVEQLKKANPDSPFVQPEFVAKSLQNIKDKNKDPKASSGRAGAVDLTAFNAAQNALKELQADYANTQKQLDAAQKAGLISQQEYLLKREALIGKEKDEVTAAYEAEIAALEAAKAKKSTSAEQRIQLDQKIADARTDMLKAQKSADSELEVLAKNEQGRLKKQELAVKTYTDALQQQVDTLRQQGQRAAAGLGQGDRQRGLTDQQNAIDDRFNSQKLDLANQYGDGSRGMSPDEYAKKLTALKVAQQDLHDTVQTNYDEMTAAQGDWSAGASSAWQNYLESARDVAGQTKSLFSNAFSSMEDAIVNFTMTGKLSFADFTKSILADMARIATRQASSALLGSLVGAATSYFTGSGPAATPSSAGSTTAGYSSTYFPQADGGAWGSGVQMFADGGAFTNSIVSKPTAFGMAGGQKGVMGEAGPEAIMPLTRTSSGALGVRALGGESGLGAPQITIETHITVDAKGNSSSNTSASTANADAVGLAKLINDGALQVVRQQVDAGGAIWRLVNDH